MKYHDKISIILAAFNAESYIHSCMESVIHQTYPNWELLVINDGSYDQTEKIIKGFSDERIKYFSQKNKGVSMARNKGLEEMTGNYFCFLDADDYFPSNSLSSRLEIFKRNPDITFVDGKIKIYDKNLEKFNSIWSPSFRGNPLSELFAISGSCFFGPSWMIRKDKNEKYRFDEKLTHGEDLLFYIESAFHGGLYDYSDEVILQYRKGHHSAMKNLNGLENGYHSIFRTLRDKEEITMNQLEGFKRKARSIIFKSYLGHFRPVDALIFLFKKW
ncbi:MAG: glycosyltransferase [Cyclobacteriaceae bacterium]|nr:glycosyltransferase [Cyclobacteriaceae bacterium]